MNHSPAPEELRKLIRAALGHAPEFLLSGDPAPVRQGWRVSLLKTGTLNPDLSTSASVDRIRLLLDHSLTSAGYRIVSSTQSKFELVLDIIPAQP